VKSAAYGAAETVKSTLGMGGEKEEADRDTPANYGRND